MNFENWWPLPIWLEALFILIDIFWTSDKLIVTLICWILSLKLQNKID